MLQHSPGQVEGVVDEAGSVSNGDDLRDTGGERQANVENAHEKTVTGQPLQTKTIYHLKPTWWLSWSCWISSFQF